MPGFGGATAMTAMQDVGTDRPDGPLRVALHNRLDAKGRVSIPAGFRQVLARDGFEGLYVHPALDVAALDAGGTALIASIDQILSRFSPFSAEWEALSTALNGTSEILKAGWRRPHPDHRKPEGTRRNRRPDRLCRSRAQVPALGAGTLQSPAGGVARAVAGCEGAAVATWRAGGMTGSEQAQAHVPVLLAEVLQALAPVAGGT